MDRDCVQLLAGGHMEDRQMKVGVWFYGLGTALTGLLDIVWRDLDGSHQPIKSMGNYVPGQHILACVAGVWLVAAGLAILWQRSSKIGAAASVVVYSIFVAFWLARYHTGIHEFGWRIDVFLGISFGLLQQVFLLAPAVIVLASAASPDPKIQERAIVAARWMLGVPPIVFGLFHLAGIRVFAGIVPQWMGFGIFWAGLTGVAFILAGGAICSGKKDILALRLLALMLLLFEGLVEIPPIFIRLHSLSTWGAAVYNMTAIGACWIFAEYLESRADRGRIESAKSVAVSRPDPVVA